LDRDIQIQALQAGLESLAEWLIVYRPNKSPRCARRKNLKSKQRCWSGFAPVSAPGEGAAMKTRKPAKAGYAPQSLSARARSAMTKAPAPLAQDVNFLMNCSQQSLESYQLAKLSLSANIQADLLELMHQWVEANTQATIARLFRITDREALKQDQ
jgi:hypothetical protein